MKLSRFRDRRMAALKLGTLVLVVIVEDILNLVEIGE